MGNIKDILGTLSCDAIDVTPLNIDWREALGEDMEGWRSFEAIECDECAIVHVLGPHGETRCNDEKSEINITDGDGDEVEVDNECDGYLNAEGPMMNYWYPVKLDNPVGAALDIGTGCVCVVEMRDGTTGLALTGGGMDLSWEICEAFIDAGYLPPVHFCDLPEMAGMKWDKHTERIVTACKESARVQAGWAKGRIRRLDELALKLRAN